MSLPGWLFPDEPRDFPFRRSLRALLRALHTLAAGIMVGAVLFGLSPEAYLPWVWATLGSGGLLLATDLHGSAAFLLEVRGVLIMMKLALTGLIGIFPSYALWILLFVFIIGSVGSHIPGRYRHRMVFLKGQVNVDRRHG